MTISIDVLPDFMPFEATAFDEEFNILFPQPIAKEGPSLTERAVEVVYSMPQSIRNSVRAVTDWFYPSITCTPEEFEELLSQNYQFPPKVIVTGYLTHDTILMASSLPTEIELQYSGLFNESTGIEREHQAPRGLQFFYSHQATEPTIVFSTLDEALTFWAKATKDDKLTIPKITIDPEHFENVILFLARLTETAEYQNLQTRPLLACRVLEAFNQMALDPEFETRAYDYIGQGLTSCDDRIISALEEIELMLLLDKIEKTDHITEELMALGKRFMLLEMVNAKAKAHKATLRWVDEIEVYLAFQIGLADRFNLPVNTRNMIFRGCAQITDAQLKRFGDQIEQAYTDEKLAAYLKTWSPWVKNERRCLVPAYETLELDPTPVSPEETCIITHDAPRQPVLYAGRMYDYAEFTKWYVKKGTDPMTRLPINLSQLKKLNKGDKT